MYLSYSNGLVRLRQSCSHPGVGSWRNGHKEMRTMDEVLEKMYDDTSAAVSKDERELFITKIKEGQIYDFWKEHHKALDLWADVLLDVEDRVSQKHGEVMELKRDRSSSASSAFFSDSDEEEYDVQDDQEIKKRQYLRTRRGNELRDLQDLQHRLTFMMASANFQLKNEADETHLYEQAERLRRDVFRLRNTAYA
jgi:hypothetical protein